MKRRRQSLLFGILLLIMGLGLGYAFLTTTLNIEGIADIDSNEWSVYFDNIQVTPGSVEAEELELDTNKTTITYHVHLEKPGDYYEVSVDVVNDGTIDAMIESVTSTINGGTTIPPYLKVSISYEDDVPIAKNHLLPAGKRETYKGIIAYKDSISADQLPSTSQTITVSFSVNYVQADSNAKEIRRTIYSVDDMPEGLGFQLPSTTQVFNTYQEAIDTLERPMFLKYTLVDNYNGNDIVQTESIGFIEGGNIYYLQGTRFKYDAVYNNWVSTSYYEWNKSVLKEALGEENCVEDTLTDNPKYDCNTSSWEIKVKKNGEIIVRSKAGAKQIRCIIEEFGIASCGVLLD